MSARCNAADISVPGNEVEPTPVARLQGRGSLGFEGASIMVCEAYDDAADDVAAAAADFGVCSLVEDANDWNLRDIPLSRDASVRTELHVDFTHVQMQYR